LFSVDFFTTRLPFSILLRVPLPHPDFNTKLRNVLRKHFQAI